MAFTFPYETCLEDLLGLKIERLRSLDETIDGYFALYEKTGREELFEDLCPYFGVPWPAGTALAKRVALQAEGWKDARVCELACGLALPTLLLAQAGVKDALATDLHPDVPEFFARNLHRNGLKARYLPLDWRGGRWEGDILLGSDLVYDRRQPAALLEFLQRSSLQECWLADPGRPYWPAFLDSAQRAGYRLALEKDGTVEVARLLPPVGLVNR